MERRVFLQTTGAAALFSLGLSGCKATDKAKDMYGLIGKMTATPGNGSALASILLEGLQGMPGNLIYIVALDPSDTDTLWITEVWETDDHHKASLQLPSVQAAIAKGRPLIAKMELVSETRPIGGQGLT